MTIKIRGGTEIHTKNMCCFFSFGAMTVQIGYVVFHGFGRELKIYADNIVELRLSKYLSPVVTIVAKEGDGYVAGRLSIWWWQSRKVRNILENFGYNQMKITSWPDTRRDERVYGLMRQTS
jgi:hypothetical protein